MCEPMQKQCVCSRQEMGDYWIATPKGLPLLLEYCCSTRSAGEIPPIQVIHCHGFHERRHILRSADDEWPEPRPQSSRFSQPSAYSASFRYNSLNFLLERRWAAITSGRTVC